MDLKELCVLTKKNLLLLSVTVTLAGCLSNSTPKPYLLKKGQNEACYQELEHVLSQLISAQHLSISKDIFSKNSSLYLTNRQNGILSPSPIYNDRSSSKHLKLYKNGERLLVTLLDKKDKVIKEEILHNCY